MWQDTASALIKKFEGLSLKPYKCPAGYNTIGYGHVIKPHEESLLSQGIVESAAEIILRGDMNLANQALNRLVSVGLNDHQRAALVSFVFNVGAGAFQASTLRQKLNRSEYACAAEQFLRWVHGGGRQLPGLVRRRHAERELFLREYKTAIPAQANSNHSQSSFWQKIKLVYSKSWR